MQPLFLGIMPMPMPIIMPSGGGGNFRPHAALAFYIALFIMIAAWLAIRYSIVRKSEYFRKQSPLKNVFYQLDEYSTLKPDLNFATLSMITVNLIALFVLLVEFIIEILN